MKHVNSGLQILILMISCWSMLMVGLLPSGENENNQIKKLLEDNQQNKNIQNH